jgi:hypothetical protein
MSTLRKRLTVPIALIIALAMAPALSGCFGNPIEGIIEGATGGDVDLGGPGIPDGFPTSEVPLIEGEVIYGASIGNDEGKVWNVTIKVADATAFDAIKAKLEGAGFTSQEGMGGVTPDGATGAFDNDKYGILVVITKDGDNGFVANYTVTTK